jgi:hypothetical protein
MATGYTRNDTTNNIANGNVINANDLDGEFDAIQAAYDVTTGHDHDGTVGGGAPIKTLGPAQDIVITTSVIRPKTDNTVDLGTSTLEFKDLFIDGTANIDSLVADTADINGGTIDGTTIGGSSAAAGTFTTATATTGNITTVNATTVDTTNIEVTNIKAKDGTASATIADTTGVMTVASAVLTTADINGGTIDGTTIGGASAAAGTFTTATATTGNITTVNATTVDSTNLEVTNIKAKDGTSAGSIADSTGVVTLASSVLTTTDINGGTIDGTTIGGSTPAAISGTTGSFSGNLTVDTDTLFVDAANNRVGVGTTSPSFELDVVGVTDPSIRVRATGAASSDDSLLRMSVGNADASNFIQFGDSSDSDAGYIRYQHANNSLQVGVNAAERMRITSAGNVGIGTSTPATTLDVNGDVTIADKIIHTGDTDTAIRFPAADTVTIETSGAERLRVTSAGLVGIGTASPSGLLTIGTSAPRLDFLETGGSTGFDTTTLFRDGDIFGIQTRNAGTFVSNDYRISTNASGALTHEWRIGNTERMRITSAGNVGIGTSSPSEMLQVTGGLSAANSLIRTGLTAAFNSFLLGYAGAGDVTDEAPAIYATNTTGSTGQAGHIAYKSRSGTERDHIFYTGTTPTERLRITSAGNVGIGTSSPSQRLSVQGDGAISRLIGSGGDFQGLQIQCADASGSVTKNVFIDAINESGVAVASQTGAILPGGGSFWSWSTQPAGTRTDRRVERARIDSSGNLGLGVTPSAWLSTVRAIQLGSGGSISNWTGSSGHLILGANYYDAGAGVDRYINTAAASKFVVDTGSFGWNIAPSGTAGNAITFTQAMTLSAGGNLLVGTTAAINVFSGTTDGVVLEGAGAVVASRNNEAAAFLRRRSSNGEIVVFLRDTTDVGSIDVTTTSTSYNTSSDYRLKENVQPMQDALAVIGQLNPVTYTWKANGSDGQGFIAHELQAVVPDCVTGEKDAVDAEGNPQYQGVDTSFLVATLVKAVQELTAKVASLEAQLNP